jgi:hypothetical protein
LCCPSAWLCQATAALVPTLPSSRRAASSHVFSRWPSTDMIMSSARIPAL